MLDVGDRLLEELTDVLVMERVDNAPPVPVTGHQPEVPEKPELVRHGRGLHGDRGGQGIHRTRPGMQTAEDPDPTRRRKRLHRVREHADERLVQLVGCPALAAMAHAVEVS